MKVAVFLEAHEHYPTTVALGGGGACAVVVVAAYGGFATLRHVGTADHLHVELPLP